MTAMSFDLPLLAGLTALLVIGLASLGLELFQAQHRGARPFGHKR